jgi:dTDP-glucose pyrophosphorylase
MQAIITAGIKDLVAVVRPDDDNLQEYLFDHFSGIAAVKTVVQEKPLGMGDALLRASMLVDDTFLVSACDNLIDQVDMKMFISRFAAKPDLDALLSLIDVEPDEIPHTAIVELRGDSVTKIIEKPDPSEVSSSIASTPLYIFSPIIKSYLADLSPSQRAEYELQDAISALILDGGKVQGFHLSGRKTLTTAKDLREMTVHYLTKADREGKLPDPPSFPGVEIHHPVLIEPGASIDPGSVIGPNVYIESGVKVSTGTTIQNNFLLKTG